MEEAYEVGRKAVQIAVDDGGGWMATILRQPGETYIASYHKVPLGEVANSFRQLPSHWITPDGLDVTVDGETLSNVAWYYASPKEAAAEIRDHVAFYAQVTVEG